MSPVSSSPTALFTLVWDALVDLLGSAATAALLRRAARRAMARAPELGELIIVREDLDYRYTLPHAWSNAEAEETQHGFRQLMVELVPLLVELTGPVVLCHLAQIPELKERGFVPAREERS
jgi:hypothetical protein